ncbi:MAG: hypothetical protein FIB07_17065 [Candidatus Methanoperedens sp.]|nr:hypothetical protein [Candidatus Methanoperedens sp.]
MPSKNINLAKRSKISETELGNNFGCSRCITMLSRADIKPYENGVIIDGPEQIFAYVDSKWYCHLKLVGDDGDARFYETDQDTAIYARKNKYIDVYPSWKHLVSSVSTVGKQWEDLKMRRVGKWKNIKEKGWIYQSAKECEENGDDIMRALFD